MKRYFTLLFVLLCVFALRAENALRSVWVPLGSAEVELTYNISMKLDIRARSNSESIIQYYHTLLETDYTTLLQDLEHKKDSLYLNDWMYYGLVRSSISIIFNEQTDFEQELIAWFMLSHAGFNTLMAYNEQRAYLYVHVEEEVFELPMIEDKLRYFYYIPYPLQYPIAVEGVYLLDFSAMPGGRALSFRWSDQPLLPERPLEKKLQLRAKDTLYNISVTIDQSMIELFAEQPILAEHTYFSAPFSPLLEASLIPQLETILAGKDQQEALEILLAFTRSSFAYRDDKEYFGKSKPMVPEEVFFYPFSDCEDRAVLFFQLVKSLLDLPMVIIAYPDHITIGVATYWPCAASITFKGQDYCICDPTGPAHSWQTGRWPKGYEDKAYEIIGAWP